jgi:pyruvate/2-oxoglutarate dehydrogenase complex dihydrolipoamide acyltransferase (E2) component
MSRQKVNWNTPWRRVAASLYSKPTDSKIFGSVELDVTELEAYIKQKRAEGLKITLTHILLLATGRAIREYAPEFNCYVRRGNIVPRNSVDASLSVLIHRDTEMSSVHIAHADQISLAQLVDTLNQSIQQTRKGAEEGQMDIKNRLASIPWPFRTWLLQLLRTLTVHWGLKLGGLSANNFGTFVLSNIGSIGLDMGYPALLPSGNLSLVLVLGGLHTKPGVVDNRIEPRRMLSLGAALDHRVVDAVHGGRLFRGLRHYINHPELLEQPAS